MNPYESPATESPRESPKGKKAGLLLRGLAVLLWIVAVAPWYWCVLVAAHIDEMPVEADPRDPAVWLGFGAAFLMLVLLPSLSLHLLGLGAWRRSWRFALAGMLILLTAVGALTVFVMFVPNPN
jgi:hypothetical protein